MKFPQWVEDKNSDSERASARLSYMMMRLSLDLTGDASLRAFCRLVGLDHSTLAYSIKKGACTPKVATHIEDALGRDRVRNEHLRKPLEITAE